MATISEALAIAIEHHQGGRLQAAEQIYRQILSAEPNQADAIHLLGMIAFQVGKHEVAVEYLGRAISLNGNRAAFHNSLGAAYCALRRIPEGVACYRRALDLKPDYAEAHYNLGNALKDLDLIGEGVACYRRALELKPDYAEAHNNLGNALKDQGLLDEAVACYRKALALKPSFAEAHNNLGTALKDLERLNEGVACYRQALEWKPDFVEAHNNLGNALKDQGKLDEAVACYRDALALKPDFVEAHNNLGNAFKDQGKLDDALACYRRALERRPDYAEAHSNLLCALHYCTGVTPTALAEAHAEYDRQHAVVPLGRAIANHNYLQDRHGPLRLGFVSPDLALHPVGFFLVRVLENLSQEKQETFCYSDRIATDTMTHRLQVATTHWRNVFGMTDQRLAEKIRADRIDILFDLAGHSAHNRLLVFARKPAPIQITWIGYEGTTGLTAMDYLLADRHMVPHGSQQYYREQVLRMPDGYLCYDPPAEAPRVGTLPALQKAHVTFGSFNNPAKITPAVVAVWAEIMRRAPTARLVLKYRGLGDPTVRRRYLDLFAAHDVEPHRLELLPWSSYAEYLATYHQVDMVLDPFPFSGSTTTCEALWMGVPVVTCPGETFASRHSLSHLSNIGLTETIAGDLDDYVDLAVSLAGDLPLLAALRSGLRKRMAGSPLCDGRRFADNLASMLQGVWNGRGG